MSDPETASHSRSFDSLQETSIRLSQCVSPIIKPVPHNLPPLSQPALQSPSSRLLDFCASVINQSHFALPHKHPPSFSSLPTDPKPTKAYSASSIPEFIPSQSPQWIAQSTSVTLASVRVADFDAASSASSQPQAKGPRKGAASSWSPAPKSVQPRKLQSASASQDEDLLGYFANSKSIRHSVSVDEMLELAHGSPPSASDHHSTPKPRTPRHHAPLHHSVSQTHSREHFINSNCKFFTCEKFDVTPYLADPDLIVPWDQIEYLEYTVQEAPVCPICLAPPLAAKMTRCGHVYCWHCILHHLANSDKTWNHCPLCEDYVYKRDLRSVVFKLELTPVPRATVKLTLMERFKHSAAVVPHSQFAALRAASTPTEAHITKDLFRVLHVDGSRLLATVLRHEEIDLHCSDCDSSDPFVSEARLALASRKASIQQHGVSVVSAAPSVDTRAADTPATDDTAVFYQLANGTNAFLIPLMTRCLLQEYGGSQHLPTEFEAVLIESERVVIDEAFRTKFKYLSHLPIGCAIILLEVDLTPVVSASTLQHFHEAFVKRDQLRKQRAREERKLERKAKAAEISEMNAMIANANQVNKVTVPVQIINPDDEFFKVSASNASSATSPVSHSFAKLVVTGIMSNVEENPTLAVANQMAKSAKQKFVNRPSDPTENPPLSSSSSRLASHPVPVRKTVWGTAIPVAAAPVPAASKPSSELGSSPALSCSPLDEIEQERCAPSYQDSFRESLAFTIDANIAAATSTRQQSKKGRKKGVLLFSTSQRGGF